MTPKQSMNIDPYERTWIFVSVGLLVVFVIAISIAGFAMGIQVPSPEARVDPRIVSESGPFSEPGLRELAPNKYEAYIMAQTWRFDPNTIEVPAGATVTFYVTSRDVQHGFKIQDTNINMQIVPGQVSVLTTTFDNPGEYDFICTEYCGSAHAIMFGTLVVTP